MIKRFTNGDSLDELVIVPNSLTTQIYLDLHDSVKFSKFEEGDVQIALDNDLFDIVVYKHREAIAMGRLVGDNRLVFFFKDIIVLPQYQGIGIGRKIMDGLMEYIAANASNGAQLALMCTTGNEAFYENMGFSLREKGINGSGMVKIYEK